MKLKVLFVILFSLVAFLSFSSKVNAASCAPSYVCVGTCAGPISAPPVYYYTDTGVTCAQNPLTMSVSPQPVITGNSLTFSLGGNGSTFISDNWGSGATPNPPPAFWPSYTATAATPGTWTWTHTYRPCSCTDNDNTGKVIGYRGCTVNYCTQSTSYTVNPVIPPTATPTPTPSSWTWTINAQPVDPSGNPNNSVSVRVFYAIWPPSPLNWIEDAAATGTHTHTITITSSTSNVYLGLESSDGVTVYQPYGSPPNPAITYGTFFNPPTWMARWNNTLPTGIYTLRFVVPLPPTSTPTSTPTPTPTPTPGGPISKTVDFCITNIHPWWQTTTGDVRMLKITNNVPNTLYASTDPNYPSLFFSSINSSEFIPGTSSTLGWNVNNEYGRNSKFEHARGLLSYEYYKFRAGQAGMTINPIATATLDLWNFGTPNTGEIWERDGDLTIQSSHSQTIKHNSRLIILVHGDLYIRSNIYVPSIAPDNALLVIAASGNIYVDSSVGVAPNTTIIPGNDSTINLEGIYSADHDFVVQSRDSACATGLADSRLNITGAIITNANNPLSKTGVGQLRNERSLCGADATYPSLNVAQRLDFLVDLTDFYRDISANWKQSQP